MKERIFADAVLPSGGFDSVYSSLSEPAVNTRHFNPRQRPSFARGQQFGAQVTHGAS